MTTPLKTFLHRPNKLSKHAHHDNASAASSPSKCWTLLPTLFTKKRQEIDLNTLNEDDVKQLQKADPFLYYSIPGVHKASLLMKEVDFSSVSSLAATATSSSSCSSTRSSTVSRRSCISTECHTSVIMEDLMNDMLDDDDSREGEVDGDHLLVLEDFLRKKLNSVMDEP
jgi:hypothetical protein